MNAFAGLGAPPVSALEPELPDWPLFGMTGDVRPALAAARAEDEPAALATLYAGEGRLPHGLGAQMVAGAAGLAGYLVGGCVEGDLLIHARTVIDGGEPRRLVYGRGGPMDLPLPCGGRIEVLLERLRPDEPAVADLLEHTRERRPCLWLSDGRRRACTLDGEGLPSALRPAFDEARRDAGRVGAAEGVVWRRFEPRLRLIVVGGDPMALALAGMGLQAGWDTVVVRPGGPVDPPPLPGVGYTRAPMAKAFERLAPDAWTAVACATHDVDADHEAIEAALRSDAFYVGALGSRGRLATRLARLEAAGLSDQAPRLHSPIGLDIGGRTPWEIAASAMAEIIQTDRAAQAARPAPWGP